LKTAKETVENFLEKLDQFTNETNTKFATFREEFLLAADMEMEQVKKLNQEELFDYAYALYGYASYIQDQINRQKVVFNLCNDQLQKMVAKYNDKFSPYTKHEMRMQMIVVDNEAA
jgi:DNA gyrase/topoisomerase IV subunit A